MRTCISACVAAALAIAAAFLTPASARACGFCDNDKLAAVFDQRIHDRAKAKGLVVVYAEVVGAVPDSAESQATLRQAVAALHAVDPKTIRVATNPVALCFAIKVAKGRDPAAATAAALAAVSARLAKQGWALKQIMTPPLPVAMP